MRKPRRAAARRHDIAPPLALAVLALFAAQAPAQEIRSTELNRLFPGTRQTEASGAAIPAPEISAPLDQVIDPETYRMVPGDLIQVEIGGEADRTWRLAVSPEGRLLLPHGAAIEAAGTTLAQVREATRAALADRFPRMPIEFHLLQPGAFRIYVTGAVAQPGVQIVHAYDRVAWAIGVAGGPVAGGSLREIVLRDTDGTEATCDLVAFLWSGSLAGNPYVTPGLTIHVPPAEEFVRVTGAVRGIAGYEQGPAPNVGSRIPEPPRIVLEWKEGDTIAFSILRAGGLSEDATGTILLLRDGERRVLAMEEARSMSTLPGDVIEAAVRDRWVYVTGAVRYPGPYPHLPSLVAADYVRLAGGPTELGRGKGWRLLGPQAGEARQAGEETYVEPGSTVIVPERWTYRVSTLLAPISGITALVISVIALRK